MQNVGLSQTLVSQGSEQRVQNDASIVENFLKFESCILSLAAGEVGLAAKVSGPVAIGPTLLVTLDWCEQLNGSCGIPSLEFDGGQKLGKVNVSE